MRQVPRNHNLDNTEDNQYSTNQLHIVGQQLFCLYTTLENNVCVVTIYHQYKTNDYQNQLAGNGFNEFNHILVRHVVRMVTEHNNSWILAPRERFELPRHEDSGFRIHRDTGLCDLGCGPSTLAFDISLTSLNIEARA